MAATDPTPTPAPSAPVVTSTPAAPPPPASVAGGAPWTTDATLAYVVSAAISAALAGVVGYGTYIDSHSTGWTTVAAIMAFVLPFAAILQQRFAAPPGYTATTIYPQGTPVHALVPKAAVWNVAQDTRARLADRRAELNARTAIPPARTGETRS